MTDKKSIVFIVIATLLAVVALGVAITSVKNTSDLRGVIEELGNNLGAIGTRFPNGLSTDATAPSAGLVRTTTLTTTGTTTLGESVDGLVVGGTISTAATGTVRTVYTNSTGPKMCDSSTGYLLVRSNGTFAPALVWSLGTSTSAANASTNLVASSTVATSTSGTITEGLIATADRLFRLGAGETITAIFADTQSSVSSSTHFSSLSAEAGIWCQDLSI